ncbi:hypothetical protein [Streptomyces liangshanensis]|uniref:hypothetical protein n=1 Tax=Streptomyces liangshanensis TaxID=2717324 RepID=UPI0036DE4C3F
MAFPTDDYQPAQVSMQVEIFDPRETVPSFGVTAVAFELPLEPRFEQAYQTLAENVRDVLLDGYPEGYLARISRHCTGGQSRQEIGELYPAPTPAAS